MGGIDPSDGGSGVGVIMLCAFSRPPSDRRREVASLTCLSLYTQRDAAKCDSAWGEGRQQGDGERWQQTLAMQYSILVALQRGRVCSRWCTALERARTVVLVVVSAGPIASWCRSASSSPCLFHLNLTARTRRYSHASCRPLRSDPSCVGAPRRPPCLALLADSASPPRRCLAPTIHIKAARVIEQACTLHRIGSA